MYKNVYIHLYLFIENSDKMQIDEFEGKAPFYNFLTHLYIYINKRS